MLISNLSRSQKGNIKIASLATFSIYIAIMYITQDFAFQENHIRLATSLYALGAVNPFYIIPIAFADLYSNMLIGGLGIWGGIGGFLTGIIGAGGCYFIKKRYYRDSYVFFPILLVGFIIPIWLCPFLGLEYMEILPNTVLGQVIPALFALLLMQTTKEY